MHQKSNYDDWSVLAELKDGQRRGDNYKNGVDAFLEYIVERAPELEPHVRRYGEERFGMTHEQQLKKQGTVNYKPPANDPLNRTLWLDRAGNKSPGLLDPGFAFEPKTLTYRDRQTGQTIEKLSSPETFATRHPEAPEGYVFSHNASARPKIRRVGAGGKGRNKGLKEPETFIDPVTGRKKRKGPVSFGMGAPVTEVNRHNAAVAKDMENLGLLADPMYEYGTILPYKKNIVTGENSWATPDIVRNVVGGLLSLGNTPKTGVYDPNALLDVNAMSPQRQSRLYALRESLKGRQLVLIEELALFFDHPVGVSGHPSFFDDIERKLLEVADIDGALDALNKHHGR